MKWAMPVRVIVRKDPFTRSRAFTSDDYFLKLPYRTQLPVILCLTLRFSYRLPLIAYKIVLCFGCNICGRCFDFVPSQVRYDPKPLLYLAFSLLFATGAESAVTSTELKSLVQHAGSHMLVYT